METAPKAGKSWQPSYEPPWKGEKQAPITLTKTVLRVGGTLEKKQPRRKVPTLEALMLIKNAQHKTTVN